MKKKKVLVFGDSHSLIWSGTDVLGEKRNLFENVNIHHLGPVLAYNLLDESGSKLGKWGKKVIEIITKSSQFNICYVILCFGEIDIRTQIIRRAISNNISIAESANLIAKRILKFADLLEEHFKITVLIWEPVPSTSNKNFSFNKDFPATGSEKERNIATLRIALTLRLETEMLQKQKKRIFCFGAYEKLTQFHETIVEYFSDGCHLNLAGLQIALKELKYLDQKFNLNTSSFFQLRDESDVHAKIHEVSQIANLTMSSLYCDQNSLKKTTRGYCFHTNHDPNPWVRIDLGYAMCVDSLEISNRIDAEQKRAATLSIHVGNNPEKLTTIYNFTGKTLLVADPKAFQINLHNKVIRYIAFSLSEPNYLHLGWVKIHAKRFYT